MAAATVDVFHSIIISFTVATTMSMDTRKTRLLVFNQISMLVLILGIIFTTGIMLNVNI